MVFADESAVIQYIKDNQNVTQYVKDARTYTKKWSALYNGTNFSSVLISQILNIEGQKKAKIRARYARDIRGFFARLSVPRQNVWAATGGSKDYDFGKVKLSDDAKAELLSFVTNTKDNKSIEAYLSSKWDRLYHTDPAGVLYIEYTTGDEGTEKMYPTYKSITTIRHYISNGQKTECILFEPVLVVNPVTKNKDKTWRVSDDVMEYSVIQDGDNYTIDPDDKKTFAHEFGWCPALIISDLTDSDGNRLSPYHDIEGEATDYARDLSVKTIYKFLHGFPKSFQMQMACGTCKGIRKADAKCKECGDTGFRKGDNDVADIMIFPFPKDKDSPQLNPQSVMGYFAPDLATWGKMDEELDRLFNEAYEGVWGVQDKTKVTKTATEIHYDMQPMINKLESYSNPAEWLEHTITEMYANHLNINKDKTIPVSSIKYGHRYILEGLDTIQKKYLDAKTAGAPVTILDAILEELILIKYKTDPVYYDLMMRKISVEPHIHLGFAEVNDLYGSTEVLKKDFFSNWWKTKEESGDALTVDIEILRNTFNTDFEVYLPTVTIEDTKQIIPIAVPPPEN